MKNIYKFLLLFSMLILSVCSISQFASASYCYQESANISNQGGNDGSCMLDYSGSYTASDNLNYIDIIYKKPLLSTNDSLWKVKIGFENVTQLTLPDTCWNYNSSALYFRVTSYHDALNGGSSSNVACLNSSSYQTLFNIGATSGIGADIKSGNYTNEFTDGDWNTSLYNTHLLSPFYSWSNNITIIDSGTKASFIYEDAMNWSLPSTCTENWVANINPCINNVELISYHDVNNCGTYVNLPANNGTNINCALNYNNSVTFSPDQIMLLILGLFIIFSLVGAIAISEHFFGLCALFFGLMMSVFITYNYPVVLSYASIFMILVLVVMWITIRKNR